ncbi:myeloid-associated differentiation marker-like protein 2 [Denticeps clupeoides]|uniref:Myeloid-associated differentiation marker-like protein 2 n=1 Tax=Denticeps clupeoides TaxID=299321 RepID=A0AAY4EF69_9TELE|nr:myeloid-associated differentiation marker-like protein 2 [Denticeps clupeoides]
MDSHGGHYLNKAALLSPIGGARLCQLALGCAVIALVKHRASYNTSYGAICMAVWCACFAATAVIFALDVTRLHTCLHVSWENLPVAFAALATLLYLTVSVIYPVHFVRLECPYSGCEERNFRMAVTACSWAAFVAYSSEVFLSRAKPGRVVGYMATPPGMLKVAQGFVGCVIFGALVNGSEYAHHVATTYCVVVFAICFTMTALIVILSISGRTAILKLPFDHFVVIYTFVVVLLYVSASVVWPIFCFDKKYGTPQRPSGCPRGRCPWDGKLVVTVLSYVNLLLYVADLIYSQRIRFVSQHPRVQL